MNFHSAVRALEAGLAAALPGAAAQQHMSPRPQREWPSGFNPARIRNAAGLLLVYPLNDAAHIVLTVRAHALRHGGQVSLPGGVVEHGETFEQAAVREAHEEISLEPARVRLLGPLTPIDIVVSGFRLHPIAAAADSRPELRPADGEVAKILELDVSGLMEPSAFVRHTMERDGRTYDVPAFVCAGADIWGATAMVLAEFLVLLGWHGPPTQPPA